MKGHQSLKEGGAKANAAAFKRFKEHNDEELGRTSAGGRFTYKRFSQIVDYNNRCDALANVFINENRPGATELPAEAAGAEAVQGAEAAE